MLKGGEWYVVAQTRKGIATYKVASIQAVERSGGTFKRPARFDLGGYWTESIERFSAGLYRGTAVVRVSALGVRRLELLSDAVAKAVERAPDVVDSKGWLEVKIPIESVERWWGRRSCGRGWRGWRGNWPGSTGRLENGDLPPDDRCARPDGWRLRGFRKAGANVPSRHRLSTLP